VHLRSRRTRQRCEIRGRQATPSVRREPAGGFNVRGGWAGVRESVDRTSVVDGGCQGRDSRRRRPSKMERVTASWVRPKIGGLPRGPARPLAPVSAAARRPSASLRTDYRKMEQDHDRNGVLPRKLQRDSFRGRRRPEPNETADSGRWGAYSSRKIVDRFPAHRNRPRKFLPNVRGGRCDALRGCQQQGRATSVGTGPIHEDPRCRALNEECDDRSGPVVRKRSIARGRRKRHLSSAISRKRRDGGVPSQRETHRKSGSPDRTAPSTPPPDVAQGSKPLPGPPQKAKIGRKSAADRRRKRSRRRPKTGIAKGRRGKRPTSKRRGGGPHWAPGRKIPNFGPHKQRQYIRIIGTPAAARNVVTGPADVTRESKANLARFVEGPRSTPPITDAAKGSNGR
jgi:hypothetical protein